jgi:hypothetical protein
MGIADEINAEFGHLHAAVQVTEEQIGVVEGQLAAMDPTVLATLLTKLGYQATQKRQAAVVIALAKEVAGLFAATVLG